VYAQVKALFAAVARDLGGLDVLVNNAGVGLFGAIADMSPEDFDTVIQTNVNGLFYCTREAIPHLRASKNAYIFNVSSLAGRNAFPGAGAYCASKHAVNGLSEVLFQEVREDGIRVTYLMPGSVATDFGRGTAAKQDWALQPSDVGEMVVDLLHTSPRALHSRVEMRPARPKKG
jgi:NAD(P)-dependent dehydrogenase (short-subunit alcohol dehydrogenase family)